MNYEEFKREIEQILLQKGKPLSWDDIITYSTKLKHIIPSHSYMQRLRKDIGLIRFKDRKTGKNLWALLRWYKKERQSFLIPPEKIKVILLCKAREVFSRKYGLTHCIAGLDEDLNWRRLYPLSAELGNDLQKWDVIEAYVRDLFPEKNRPETVKIWPKEVKRIKRIDDMEKRIEILNRATENGAFLHLNDWKKKSIGLIKPRNPRFIEEGEEIKCEFYCDYKKCRGHLMTVWDADIYDRRTLYEFEQESLYFLLGTHKFHPHKWLLISIINLAEKRHLTLQNFT